MAQLSIAANSSQLKVGITVGVSNPHFADQSAALPALDQNVRLEFPSGLTLTGTVVRSESICFEVKFPDKRICFSRCDSSGIAGKVIDFHYRVISIDS